ncbi:hypothetical protein [Isoptericola croceus]|uniref:hypothetical protein n=1 Tax=Isoptericola croceus TaxID=3031406 RepID=UPI0023F7AAE2|nr:hypothetical protein [Isoptericola croceus]
MDSVVVGPRPSLLTRVEPWLSSRLPDAPPHAVVIIGAGATDAERDAARERVLAAASAADRLQRRHAVAQLVMLVLALGFFAVTTGVLPMTDEVIPLALVVLVPLFFLVVVVDLRRIRQIRRHLNVPHTLAEEVAAVRLIALTGMGSPPGDVRVKELVDVLRTRSPHDQARVASMLWDYSAALEAEAASWQSPEASEAALQESRAAAARIEAEFSVYQTASDQLR